MKKDKLTTIIAYFEHSYYLAESPKQGFEGKKWGFAPLLTLNFTLWCRALALTLKNPLTKPLEYVNIFTTQCN